MIVSGNCRGRNFADSIIFTLIPPEGHDYYGNGYYMNVEIDNAIHYVDCRYARTTDIEKLATIWIQDFYGKNAQVIRKIA